MKMSRILVVLFGAAFLFSSAVLAGETNKGTLKLSDNNVVVDGKALAPGNYKVEWDGSGPTVQVKLLQGKQTVATLPAHLIDQAKPNSQDAYSTATATDGSKSITAVYPSGKRFALQIDRNEATPQSGN